jgi:hypothetical protein
MASIRKSLLGAEHLLNLCSVSGGFNAGGLEGDRSVSLGKSSKEGKGRERGQASGMSGEIYKMRDTKRDGDGVE